jgi:hypothetical protein
MLQNFIIESEQKTTIYALLDVAAFSRFWSSYNEGKEVQLIVYRENHSGNYFYS